MSKQDKVLLGFIIALCIVVFLGDQYDKKHLKNAPDIAVQQAAPNNLAAYKAISSEKLLAALKANPAAAKEKYDHQNLAISGYIAGIDEDAQCIVIAQKGSSYPESIHCYINGKTAKNELLDFRLKEQATVYGTVVSVSDGQGYHVIAKKIETK